MLQLVDLHTHYGLSHVLHGISLSVGAGEVVGLFGRNGVGKTTVMKTIAGWVGPSRRRASSSTARTSAARRPTRSAAGASASSRRIAASSRA